MGKKERIMSYPPFRELLKLSDLFTPEAKQEMIDYLREAAKTRKLTPEEKVWFLTNIVSHEPVVGDFSNRREDWYDDDGR
jgi:hypothetical protein